MELLSIIRDGILELNKKIKLKVLAATTNYLVPNIVIADTGVSITVHDNNTPSPIVYVRTSFKTPRSFALDLQSPKFFKQAITAIKVLTDENDKLNYKNIVHEFYG